MTDRITRRDALKLGTNAAVSVAVTPLWPGELTRSLVVAETPNQSASAASRAVAAPPSDICFLRAVDRWS
jgi:hypothetical protein